MTRLSDREILASLLRNDLHAFVHKVFLTVSPGHAYLDNWHIEAIVFELLQTLSGNNKRLIINQPPRSLKSICTSIAFIAWALGHDPTLRFACISYSNELATLFSRHFRQVVTSPWYRSLFPHIQLTKDTETECVMVQGGGRVALSVGGTFTGRGADFIIIDDPLKADDALSEKARAGVNEWFSTTLLSRLNDKRTGIIILVMQRLHEEDLSGKLLAAGGWRHLDLPAIAIADQTITIGHNRTYHRREGDVLHPEREPRETLDAIKRELGTLTFSAQYQQRPIPLEGNLIRRSWFPRYEVIPAKAPGTQIVQSWDIATTTGLRNDYSVCTTWLFDRRRSYLLDVLRRRLEFPDVRRAVIASAEHYKASVILIEDAGLSRPLIQDLLSNRPFGIPQPIAIKPEKDKIVRLEGVSARIEAGEVLLPQDAPWLGDFLSEVLGFPNATHDDQVDSLSQYLTWARDRPKGWTHESLDKFANLTDHIARRIEMFGP